LATRSSVLAVQGGKRSGVMLLVVLFLLVFAENYGQPGLYYVSSKTTSISARYPQNSYSLQWWSSWYRVMHC